jgi:hypothetical protein
MGFASSFVFILDYSVWVPPALVSPLGVGSFPLCTLEAAVFCLWCAGIQCDLRAELISGWRYLLLEGGEEMISSISRIVASVRRGTAGNLKASMYALYLVDIGVINEMYNYEHVTCEILPLICKVICCAGMSCSRKSVELEVISNWSCGSGTSLTLQL